SQNRNLPALGRGKRSWPPSASPRPSGRRTLPSLRRLAVRGQELPSSRLIPSQPLQRPSYPGSGDFREGWHARALPISRLQKGIRTRLLLYCGIHCYSLGTLVAVVESELLIEKALLLDAA